MWKGKPDVARARESTTAPPDPDAIAEAYWQLHLQPESAWGFELDLGPWVEKVQSDPIVASPMGRGRSEAPGEEKRRRLSIATSQFATEMSPLTPTLSLGVDFGRG